MWRVLEFFACLCPSLERPRGQLAVDNILAYIIYRLPTSFYSNVFARFSFHKASVATPNRAPCGVMVRLLNPNSAVTSRREFLLVLIRQFDDLAVVGKLTSGQSENDNGS